MTDPKRTGPVWSVFAAFPGGTKVKAGFFPAPDADAAISRARQVLGGVEQYKNCTWSAMKASQVKHGRAA